MLKLEAKCERIKGLRKPLQYFQSQSGVNTKITRMQVNKNTFLMFLAASGFYCA